MIRPCCDQDFDLILETINDGAQAYKNVIPPDCWRNPYMSREELQSELREGVAFWAYQEDDALKGVMGIQHVEDVSLIRHAYVRSEHQKCGIGKRLLSHLLTLTDSPVLVGTWADADWAIRFYEKHGFQVVGSKEKLWLLRRYWCVPGRQVEVSVVLSQITCKETAAKR